MATAHPITPPPPLEDLPADAAESATEVALVPARELAALAEIDLAPDSTAVRLPVELEVGVPVRNFRVCNLLALEAGVIVESRWGQGEDLPLTAGNVHLAWTEFEVMDTQLAARLTRLA